MKIAIIGGGWVGCHLASVLKDNNEIVLYERDQIFSGASLFNQNRLHLGYHYSRSHNTRLLCKNTFSKFYNQYSFLVDDIEKNVYSVPFDDSLIDFNTYLKIFQDFDTHQITNIGGLKNIEGSILVQEKYINPLKSKKFFEEHLKDIIEYRVLDYNDIEDLSGRYDLVINATNNNLCPIKENTFREKCVVLLYKKVKETEFDALTLVDGKLMSIYPYDKENNLYSLTDVEFTPKGRMPLDYIRENMESKIIKYYENFLNDFEYHSYAESVKYKVRNLSDTRVPLIKQHSNVISCFTGKIQGIYLIEDYIKNL
jgi:hypothetical protein